MGKAQSAVSLAFKAVAMATALASIILGVLKVSCLETYVMLLSVGLFALALASITEHQEKK